MLYKWLVLYMLVFICVSLILESTDYATLISLAVSFVLMVIIKHTDE